MGRPRSFAARRSGGRAPNRSWSSFVINAPVNVPAASKVLLATGILSNINIDETVLRTVGEIVTASDQFAVTEEQIGAFGMIVVNDVAAGVGVGSVPGPMTNGADDWFVYQPLIQFLAVPTSVGVEAQFGTVHQVNSKAKRIVSEGRLIAFVVENLHATDAFNIIWNLRVLTMVRGTR